MVDALTRERVRRSEVQTDLMIGVDGTETVQGIAQAINDPAFKRTAYADPQWLATIAEGAAIGVLGLMTKCAAVWLPDSIYAWNQPTRAIPLTLLATACESSGRQE